MAERKLLQIEAFQGIDQSAGDFGRSAAASPDALNFISRFGALRTSRAPLDWKTPLPQAGERIWQAFFGADRTVLMASGGGCVYALAGGEWKTLGEGFASDDWRAVNYRHGEDDWVILVNGVDTARYWDGESNSLSQLTITQGKEALVFSQITLVYERLWGAVRAGEPDRVYWSESFSPENWEFATGAGEEGGGFVDVATFDGSRIRAICAAFDDVLIFKDKSVHRLNGTYPGEFSLTQAYGSSGTLAARTIVHTADRLYFLSSEGLCLYDGMTVSSLASRGDRRLKEVWARVNQKAVDQACAAVCGDVLYLALPLDGATKNSHVVEYGLLDGACSLTDWSGVTDLLLWREGQEERLVCLMGERVCLYDADGEAPVCAVWNSPILSIKSLAGRKRTGRLYLSVNAHALNAARQPRIRLTLLSGDRSRACEIPLREGRNTVRRRLTIRGRDFRFRIENVDGDPLALNRGMEILLEEEVDE